MSPVAEVLDDGRRRSPLEATSSTQSAAEPRICGWCRSRLEESAPAGSRFCGRKCRQSAFRLRQRNGVEAAHGLPMRMAYADPPYPGLSSKYYRDEPTFDGEVDHPALIATLIAANYDGWALSTSAKALRDILPLCPAGARVCAWVKPIGASPLTHGIHNTWEPLIVVGGRQQRPGKRDWLSAQPARHGGELPGRKPIAFCAWLFAMLGMRPGDTLDDLFPGTGVVSRAWASLAPASATPGGDASSEYSVDASSSGDGDSGVRRGGVAGVGGAVRIGERDGT